MTSTRSPLRVRGFPVLGLSYGLNQFGDYVGIVALALLVLDRTGSAWATTALFLCGKFVPAFVSPALTAALSHRRAGQVLPALYAVEAVAFVGLALLAGPHFSLAAVLALAFADGLLALTARGLSRGAVAALLTPVGLLREGNGMLNTVFAACSVAGPLIAALVVQLGSVRTALLLDAGSFLAAAALLIAGGRTLPAPETGPRERWRARLKDGLDYVRGHAVARRLVVGEALAWLFFTVPLPVTVVFARETLGASDAGYGVMVGCWGAGALVGSALFARARAIPLATLIVVSTAAIGVAYGIMAASPTLVIACVGSTIGGLGNGMQWVSVMTALQEVVGDRYQARAAGLLEAATDAIPAVGFAVGGAAAALISPRLAFAIAAAGTLVMVVVWIRRPLVPRDLIRPGPVPDEESRPDPVA